MCINTSITVGSGCVSVQTNVCARVRVSTGGIIVSVGCAGYVTEPVCLRE